MKHLPSARVMVSGPGIKPHIGFCAQWGKENIWYDAHASGEDRSPDIGGEIGLV